VQCPECSQENRDGAKFCDNCGHALTPQGAAAQEDETTPGLENEPLSALLPKKPVFVAPSASVGEAVATMNRRSIGCVLVGSREDVAGIFTERDLLFGIGENYEKAKDRPVSEFMTSHPEMFDADLPLMQVLGRISAGGFRHIPVTRDGRLIGVVSLRDLLTLVSKWYPGLVG
jgi:CBS domain-containing protein